ncbi:MAG: molybdopterin dinucleotide binding domain-containing protein, partial [Lysobacter sp.]
TYFDPLPIWYEPFEGEEARWRATGSRADERQSAAREGRSDTLSEHPFPLSAVTQRPMFMYHAWGAQNAWLRQIATHNFLYLHPGTGARYGINDEDWVTVQSHHGTITVQAKFAANTQPDTVWTWNAIGKRKGAWRLAKDAPEGRKGFLLNHLISDITPKGDYANADPVTGQAAWFDLRVRIARTTPLAQSDPQFAPLAFTTADNQPLRYGVGFREKNSRRKDER